MLFVCFVIHMVDYLTNIIIIFAQLRGVFYKGIVIIMNRILGGHLSRFAVEILYITLQSLTFGQLVTNLVRNYPVSCKNLSP